MNVLAMPLHREASTPCRVVALDRGWSHDVSEDPTAAWTTEYCLRPYNPYRVGGAQNPAFVHALDGRLLDFKDGVDLAVKLETRAFLRALEQLEFPFRTLLVVVPGHDAKPSNEGAPLARVAHALAAIEARCLACPDALVRATPALKRAIGGSRSIQANVDSMRVTGPASVRGATIIILDDTVTTGNSIAAVRQLLVEAGARRVGAIALARTVKYFCRNQTHD
jgi:hypothetical protein